MSDAPTLVVETSELESLDGVEVEGDVFHHFFRARRFAAGQQVRVADGAGAARFGEVESVGKHRARIVLGASAPAREPRLRLTVASATLRPERASWLVEKCTEVGVARFLWFNSERAPRRLGDSARGRLARVARSAVEQSGRSRLPGIETATWEELVDRVAEVGGVLLDLTPDGERPTSPLDSVSGLPPSKPEGPAPLLLLGPEGGFSSTERRQLRDAGAHPLWLGPRTLRAETAAVVGAALLLGRDND